MNSVGMAYGIAAFGIIWYIVMWAISLLGCIAARRRYRSRPVSLASTSSDPNAPGVSILRPLKGLDTNLYENLESTFKQDYPNYEIILSAADPKDQALDVVRALIERYPEVDAKILIGEEIVGVNPKVNNLIRPFRQAAHDLLWVIDSGVIVDRGTLARSIDLFADFAESRSQTRLGLIHHVPYAVVDSNKIGSRLEAAFLNTNHAKMYIAINTVGIESCVVGKSNIYRRSDVERTNSSMIPIKKQVAQRYEAKSYGLAAFGRFLAEDNSIAASLWHELGLRHDLSCDVARNVIGNMSLQDYVWRRVRWIRVRKHMVLAATIVEPFTESLMLSIIGALSFGQIFDIPWWIFMPLHFCLWTSVDLDVKASIGLGDFQQDQNASFLAAYAAREILAFPIWLIAICGNQIQWRGKYYEVLKNGEASLSNNQIQ